MTYLTEEELKQLSELKNTHAKLVAEMQENQSALSQIKTQIRGKLLNAKQYKSCCDGQQRRIQRINWIGNEMRAVKARIQEITCLDDLRHKEAREVEVVELVKTTEKSESSDLTLIMEIATIRDEYRRFSADPTRISSMRRNAAEFANRLDAIVSRYTP